MKRHTRWGINYVGQWTHEHTNERTNAGVSRCAYWQKLPLDQELIDRLIFQDACSSLIGSRSALKRRLVQVSLQDLPRRQLPLWQIRCIRLEYCDQVALLLRVHQCLCDGMGLMSMLVSHLADQPPPSTTTFIRTCNGTMTATNCEHCACFFFPFFPLPTSLASLCDFSRP